MKRIGAILCLSVMLVFISASVCFAGQGELTIEEQYPKDGATGTAVENASIKVWFNQEVRPANKEIRKANKKAVKLVDGKGKEVPIYVAYSPDENMMMVLSSNEAKIEGDTKYTLTIDPSFQASGGDRLAAPDKVAFTTLDQSQNMTVNMVMMGVMMVGMIFFSSRSMKKQMEKDKADKGKRDTVNPYKEAKRTGKSVAEIVEKDSKTKEKEAAAAAKRAAKRAKAEQNDIEGDSLNNKRVAGPRPISAVGGKYKVQPAKGKPQQKQGTTRPKNQTGKQKNTKNKQKKK